MSSRRLCRSGPIYKRGPLSWPWPISSAASRIPSNRPLASRPSSVTMWNESISTCPTRPIEAGKTKSCTVHYRSMRVSCLTRHCSLHMAFRCRYGARPALTRFLLFGPCLVPCSRPHSACPCILPFQSVGNEVGLITRIMVQSPPSNSAAQRSQHREDSPVGAHLGQSDGSAIENADFVLLSDSAKAAEFQVPDELVLDWPFDFGRGDAFAFLGQDRGFA